MNSIMCAKCRELVEFNSDECTECAQEEAFTVVECPYCKTKNAISWTASIDFDARVADQDEILELFEYYGG